MSILASLLPLRLWLIAPKLLLVLMVQMGWSAEGLCNGPSWSLPAWLTELECVCVWVVRIKNIGYLGTAKYVVIKTFS